VFRRFRPKFLSTFRIPNVLPYEWVAPELYGTPVRVWSLFFFTANTFLPQRENSGRKLFRERACCKYNLPIVSICINADTPCLQRIAYIANNTYAMIVRILTTRKIRSIKRNALADIISLFGGAFRSAGSYAGTLLTRMPTSSIFFDPRGLKTNSVFRRNANRGRKRLTRSW